MEILSTDRLVIRELETNDVPALMKIFSNPIARKYAPDTKNLEEVNTWIERILAAYEEHGHCLWALIRKKQNDFVGMCGLIQQHIREYGETELGYHLIPHYWGNGYATEAGKSCLGYAFNQLDKNKVVSFINPKNSPSIAVAKRVGMTKEIDLKPNENSWGRDIAVYSITK